MICRAAPLGPLYYTMPYIHALIWYVYFMAAIRICMNEVKDGISSIGSCRVSGNPSSSECSELIACNCSNYFFT